MLCVEECRLVKMDPPVQTEMESSQYIVLCFRQNFHDSIYHFNIVGEFIFPVSSKSCQFVCSYFISFSIKGFSLDSGKGIVSQDEMTFVSGAPRANHSGAVVLLKKEKNQRALSLEHMFEGEGLASSFGYDVAVVDLNNDRYGLGNSYNEGWQSGLFLL